MFYWLYLTFASTGYVPILNLLKYQTTRTGLAEPLEAARVDLVFCAGPLMKSLWDALPPTRRGGYAETAAELAPQVVRAVEPGDVVMVKGSNGSRAGAVAAALVAIDTGGEAG